MHTRIMQFAVLTVAAQAANAATYAERLGWRPDDKVLIVHCDDAGMSLASNNGALAALDAGLVTSVSIMMPCPWVPGFARYAVRHPELDSGLHLTLTSEWDDYRWMPVAGKPAVPGLTDPQGCLWDNNRLVKEHATADEVETEIRAQIDRAETMGIKITHLDSHMGVLFFYEPYFRRLMKVAIEKQLPFLIAAGDARRTLEDKEDRAAVALFNKYAETVWRAGLPVIDDVHAASYDWKTTEKKQLYINAFKHLRPGITEMIVHCTKPNDVIGVITGGRTHLYGDYRALTDPAVKRVVEDEHIILTTWRELKARRDRLKNAK